MAKRQVLSDESVNAKGFIVLNEGLRWARFKKNPVLLVEHEEDSEPVGKVTDIRDEGKRTTAILKFADTERARQKEKLYNEGFYNAVSIGGSAKKVSRNGATYAVEFEVFEVSLVAVPANENAVSYETDKLHVLFNEKNEGEWIETLSAKENEILTKHITMKEKETEQKEQIVPATENLSTQETEEKKEAQSEETTDESLSTAKAEADDPGWVKQVLNAIGNLGKTKEKLDAKADEEADEQPEEDEVTLSVKEDAKIFEKPKIQVKHDNMKVQSMLNWLNTDEGQYKMSEVAKLSALSLQDAKASTHPAHGTQIGFLREFGDKLKNDPVMMEYLKEFRFDVDGGRAESVPEMAVRLSSGQNTADFITNTPDLGKAVWLSMFLQQLLPEDSWAARTQKASGADRVGMIWAQSSINPAIYMGNRAPLNAPNYLYDDIARGLVTKVFSVQPTEWQPSNTDVLGYNNMATGMAEIARLVSSDIHQYTLQVAAEEASEVVVMSGPTIAADGWFPNLNPAATGNITSLSVQDLALLTAKFINENFQMDMYQGTLVLDARYAAAFKTDDNVTSILRKNAGDVRTRFTQFDAWDIYSRSRVIGYDTASSAVIDPEWYLDGKVNPDGSIPTYTPPVIPATTYGAGLAFMPNQIIMALGNTNVHMVSNPNDYAWKVSADIRFGAGVMRQDGVGVKVIAPAVV